jgi:hypothetical protein
MACSVSLLRAGDAPYHGALGSPGPVQREAYARGGEALEVVEATLEIPYHLELRGRRLE